MCWDYISNSTRRLSNISKHVRVSLMNPNVFEVDHEHNYFLSFVHVSVVRTYLCWVQVLNPAQSYVIGLFICVEYCMLHVLIGIQDSFAQHLGTKLSPLGTSWCFQLFTNSSHVLVRRVDSVQTGASACGITPMGKMPGKNQCSAWSVTWKQHMDWLVGSSTSCLEALQTSSPGRYPCPPLYALEMYTHGLFVLPQMQCLPEVTLPWLTELNGM